MPGQIICLNSNYQQWDCIAGGGMCRNSETCTLHTSSSPRHDACDRSKNIIARIHESIAINLRVAMPFPIVNPSNRAVLFQTVTLMRCSTIWALWLRPIKIVLWYALLHERRWSLPIISHRKPIIGETRFRYLKRRSWSIFRYHHYSIIEELRGQQ
jgi:hypothetical protein